MIVERVITVEYLDPSMSRNLLCKFPDALAFGFNYSESGIWSPLLPRGRSGSELALNMESLEKYSDGSRILSSEKLRRVKGKMFKKKKKVMNVINKRLDFSPNPTPKRGWNRLLKAAAKRLKVQRRAAIQMMLPTL